MTREEQLLEYVKVQSAFIYFLKRYGKISEPPTLGGGRGGTIQFQLWPHVIDGVKHLLEDRLIIVVKPRQIGWSWLLAHYAIWIAITQDNSRVMLFSKGEKECWELMSKCKFVWSQLPDFMRFTMNPNSNEEIGFPDKFSKIKAFASTESAGVGETATAVIADELEWHPYASQNFNQVKPTIDAGGQYIGCSTVDKRRPDTLLKNLFKSAYYEGNNGFTPLFYPYSVRPGRDDKWYADTMASIPSDELGGLTPDLYMQQNYPKTIEEALSPVQSVSVFDLEALDRMMADVRAPLDVKTKYPDLDHNICKIYKDYQVGKTYVAASDVAHGVGKDYSVTVLMDVRTCEVVADIMTNKMSVENFALWSTRLLNVYKNPKWWPEDNDCGKWLIGTADELGYKNWGYYDEKKTKRGFHTGAATRNELWGGLIPAINNNQVIIPNSRGIAQFRDVQYYTGVDGLKEPRIQAAVGRHDDYPVAVGIAVWACDKVPLNESQLKPISTLSFNRNRSDDFFRSGKQPDSKPLSTLTFRR